MTVTRQDNAIVLNGDCGVEDVEALVGHLESQAELPVDVSAATAIHTALWQALMVFRPTIIGTENSALMTGKILQGLATYLGDSDQP